MAVSVRDFGRSNCEARILAAAARLGHSLIDLYVLTIRRLESIEQRTLEVEGEGQALDHRRIDEYLALLESQRITPLSERSWGTFDELAQIAKNFELILDVNAPDTRDKPLVEATRYFGAL